MSPSRSRALRSWTKPIKIWWFQCLCSVCSLYHIVFLYDIDSRHNTKSIDNHIFYWFCPGSDSCGRDSYNCLLFLLTVYVSSRLAIATGQAPWQRRPSVDKATPLSCRSRGAWEQPPRGAPGYRVLSDILFRLDLIANCSHTVQLTLQALSPALALYDPFGVDVPLNWYHHHHVDPLFLLNKHVKLFCYWVELGRREEGWVVVSVVVSVVVQFNRAVQEFTCMCFNCTIQLDPILAECGEIFTLDQQKKNHSKKARPFLQKCGVAVTKHVLA